MARLKRPSTEPPDPNDRQAMLAKRAEQAKIREWISGGRFPVDTSGPLFNGLGEGDEEHAWLIYSDGTTRRVYSRRPPWTRDRLDGDGDWRFVDDGEPIPAETW